MKAIVKKEFTDRDNKNLVYSPQTIIEVEDPVRINRMIEQGIVEQYAGENEPSVFLPLSDFIRESRDRVLEKIAGNMIQIDGYDYPFAINRFQITQEDYCVILGITPNMMKKNDDFYAQEINPQYPFITRRWMIKGKATQSLDRIKPLISALGILTGQRFRLPTINEWEFVASNKRQSLDKECINNNDLHIVGSKSPNELGIFDMLDNGLELCSMRIGNNPLYVGKGRSIRANEYEVTDYYSRPYCLWPVTIRLVLSSELPDSIVESHPDLESEIFDVLDRSYDDYSDLRDNWEN